METYDDKDIKDINWAKYKIVVPTEKDKKELEAAFHHLHDLNFDTNLVPVNQLVHEYYTAEISGDPRVKNNIIVNKTLFNSLED